MRLCALLLALACVLPFAARAYALEPLPDWDSATDSNGTVTLNEDGSITIAGANDPLPEQPRFDASTSATTSANEGEMVSFLWTFWTTDGAFYDKPQYLSAGQWISLAEGGTQQATGYLEVVLAAGDLFGFRILSTDSCCGIGYLNIAPGSPTPTPEPTPEPTPTPTPEPTPEPTPTQIPETPEPSPSVAPTPTPEPSAMPSPTSTEDPSQEPTIEPTPDPTLPPTPKPTPEPSPVSPEPEPTPVPTPSESVSPDPTSVPSPESEQPALPSPVEAVGAAVEAVGQVFADIAAIAEIGKDLDPAEKEQAQPVAVALISSQIASISAAAANAARSAATIGGGGPAGGSGASPSRKGTRRD